MKAQESDSGEILKTTTLKFLFINIYANYVLQCTVHSFSDAEKEAFCEHINKCLSNDPYVKYLLPLDGTSMDLFKKFGNGLLLCRLIGATRVDAVDYKLLNTKPEMNIYQKTGTVMVIEFS